MAFNLSCYMPICKELFIIICTRTGVISSFAPFYIDPSRHIKFGMSSPITDCHEDDHCLILQLKDLVFEVTARIDCFFLIICNVVKTQAI